MSTGTILALIPSPDRGVWQLGPVPIRAYALCILAGIVVAIIWGERRWRARGGQPGTIIDVAVWAVPFGLVGGRLYHVATDWPRYFGPGADPLDAVKIWQGGLGIWGAVALGMFGAWIACRLRGIPLPALADAVAPGILAGQVIGRLGNWFNQELYGGPTDLPWGMKIYDRVNPETGAFDPLGGVAQGPVVDVVHPTFLYEMLWNIGVIVLLLWAERRFRLGHGRVFALYVAGYTAGRFWIEMVRVDPATMVFGLRINVITSVVVFLVAVSYLLLARAGQEDAATLRGRGSDGGSGINGSGGVNGSGGEESAAPTRTGSAVDGAAGPPSAERKGTEQPATEPVNGPDQPGDLR